MDAFYMCAQATAWALHLASCLVLPYVLGAVAKVDLEVQTDKSRNALFVWVGLGLATSASVLILPAWIAWPVFLLGVVCGLPAFEGIRSGLFMKRKAPPRKHMTAPDIYANVPSSVERAALLFVYGGQALVRAGTSLACHGRDVVGIAAEQGMTGENLPNTPSSPVLGLDGEWDSQGAARRRSTLKRRQMRNVSSGGMSAADSLDEAGTSGDERRSTATSTPRAQTPETRSPATTTSTSRIAAIKEEVVSSDAIGVAMATETQKAADEATQPEHPGHSGGKSQVDQQDGSIADVVHSDNPVELKDDETTAKEDLTAHVDEGGDLQHRGTQEADDGMGAGADASTRVEMTSMNHDNDQRDESRKDDIPTDSTSISQSPSEVVASKVEATPHSSSDGNTPTREQVSSKPSAISSNTLASTGSQSAEGNRKWYAGYEGHISKDFFTGNLKYDSNMNDSKQCRLQVSPEAIIVAKQKRLYKKIEYDTLKRLDIKREESFLFGQTLFLVISLKDNSAFVFQSASASDIRAEILQVINDRGRQA